MIERGERDVALILGERAESGRQMCVQDVLDALQAFERLESQDL